MEKYKSAGQYGEALAKELGDPLSHVVDLVSALCFCYVTDTLGDLGDDLLCSLVSCLFVMVTDTLGELGDA